jgi:hypothetical protein
VTERKRHGRKLLIASIGVAAVSYVACGDSSTESTGTTPGAGGSATAGSQGHGGTAGDNTFVGNTGGMVGTGGSGGNVGIAGNIAVGNLMVILPDASTIKDAAAEKPVVVGFDVLVANLIAPPPPDAKADSK